MAENSQQLPRQYRPSHVIYLEMCRMETAGLVQTDKYRALSEEYHETMAHERKVGLGV